LFLIFLIFYHSIGFRSNSRSPSIQTSSLVGCIANTDIPSYANIVTIESSKLTPNLWYNRNEINHEGWYLSSDIRIKTCQIDLKRANIIKEIYKTEHDYLGHLKNLIDVCIN
jgi:hypothetical protein